MSNTTIKIKGIELTTEEAKEIWHELNQLFGKSEPVTYPVCPRDQWPTPMWEPIITC
jgi:hypothetical protein